MVGEMIRYRRRLTGLDRDGEKITLEGEGLFARCLQHEMDHLDGVLYTDKARDIRPAVSADELAAVEAAGAEMPPAEPALPN